MAKHNNQPDLETDEAPSIDKFPYLPSLPMNRPRDNMDEPVRTSQNWSEPVPTSENWSEPVPTSENWPATTTSCGSATTSVTSSTTTDSGFVTTAEDSNSNSIRLSSLIDSLCLSSETEDQIQSSFSGSSSQHHAEAGEPSAKKTLNYSTLMSSMATIKVNPDICLQQDDDGDTILHMAVLHSHIVYILIILQAVVSPLILHLKNSMSQTALHLAVLRRKPQIVRLLMAHGAPVEARDRNGNTALHLACRDGDLDCVKQLTLPLTSEERDRCHYRFQPCVLPQDPNVRNYHGDGCLHLAAAGGHLDIVKYLLEGPTRADVNFADGRSGRTILHHAVESRDMAVLSFLLQYRFACGLNLDAQAYCGNTALSLAVGRGYRDVVEFLLLAGADTSGLTPSGEPLDYLSSSPSSETSSTCTDVSMDSEDFENNDDDDDYYDDFCVKGRPVHSSERTWFMFSKS